MNIEVQESHSVELRLQEEKIVKISRTPKRTLSPQEEKVHLIRKIEAVFNKNNRLREKQDTLHNTITDLRKLLELVGNESLEECSELHRQTKDLAQKTAEMERRLMYSHKEGSHIQRCALFWREFIE